MGGCLRRSVAVRLSFEVLAILAGAALAFWPCPVASQTPKIPISPDLPPLSWPTSRPSLRPSTPELSIGAAASKPTSRGKPSEIKLDDQTIVGQKQRPSLPASSFRIEIGDLQIIPRKNAAEQLMLAPGVLTTNHGGEGHAQETYMRGFAAGEGRDIEFLLDGVPLNEVSNPHGHGYTDLALIPPEVVRSLEITEGPFDASQGDFAFAGSANYRLGVEERGARLTYRLGMWGSHRLMMLYAPPKEPAETFAGFEFSRTEGYGQNRAAQRATGIGRYVIRDSGTFRLVASVYGYTARYDQAGVVRQDDLLLGKIGFYDTYDTNQGGESNRLLLSIDTAFGPASSRFQQVAFVGYRTMRLRSNFTGWLNDVRFETDGTPVSQQRGDGLEGRYNVLTAGSRGLYTLQTRIAQKPQSFSLGYAIRFDHGASSLLRLRSISAIPYRRVFDFDFTTVNLAGWLQTQIQWTDWLSMRAGLRVDTFSFGVTDLNLPTSDREGRRETTQTAQAFGFALNPRLTFDVRLLEGLRLLASYGQGTRSTEAAALSNNETAPFARAHVAEAGLAYNLGKPGEPLVFQGQVSYVFSYVDKDFIFDESLGRNVLGTSSLRHAVLAGLRLNLFRWLDGLLNLGWAHAIRLDTGELFPYIPQVILRAEIAATGPLFGWAIGSQAVVGRLGLGFTYVPGRPLPLKEWGDPFYLMNLGASLRLWHTEIGIEIRNLLGFDYRQSEFFYPSNFAGPTAIPSRLPQRHFAAGEPLTVAATLTLHLEAMITSP